VTEEPDSSAIDPGATAEHRDGREGVVRQILSRRVGQASRRPADAPIVTSQHRDAARREEVGHELERPEAEDVGVPVVRSAPRQQHDRRKRAASRRQTERTGDGDRTALKGHFFVPGHPRIRAEEHRMAEHQHAHDQKLSHYPLLVV
jgi:hypothetical protein